MAAPFLLCCWIPPDSLLSHERQFFAKNTVHPVNGYRNKKLAVCPLSELGFLRISTHPKAYHHRMSVARQALQDFIAHDQVQFIADDVPALKAAAAKSGDLTDCYLGELAAQHNAKLATSDAGIKHAAVELIS